MNLYHNDSNKCPECLFNFGGQKGGTCFGGVVQYIFGETLQTDSIKTQSFNNNLNKNKNNKDLKNNWNARVWYPSSLL